MENQNPNNQLQKMCIRDRIKSDDVVGRSKAYEAIVKGEPMPQPGIPESLNVLLHELRGLGSVSYTHLYYVHRMLKLLQKKLVLIMLVWTNISKRSKVDGLILM